MLASNRSIEYVNSLMIEGLTVLKNAGGVMDYRDLKRKFLHLAAPYNVVLAMQKMGAVERTKLKGRESVIRLKDLPTVTRLLDLVELADGFGLCEVENTTLNLGSRYLTERSGLDNHPYIPPTGDLSWVKFLRNCGTGRQRHGIPPFLQRTGKPKTWVMDEDIYTKVKIWGEISQLLRSTDWYSVPPVLAVVRPRAQRGGVCFLNQLKVGILRTLLREDNVGGRDVIRRFYTEDLSDGMFYMELRGLVNMGILSKSGKGAGSTYLLKNRDKTLGMLNRIDSIDGYGLDRVEQTVLNNVMLLSQAVSKNPPDLAVISAAKARLYYCQGKGNGEVFNKVTVCVDGRKRTDLIPTADILNKVKVWGEITTLITSI